MANLPVKKDDGTTTVYMGASGAGSDGDPFILNHAATDRGPSWTVVRTYTTSADMTTAAAITAAPTGGQKIVADDILVSAAVAMEFSVQMETSANVLASIFLPASGTAQITMRDFIKGDAADKKLYGKASIAGAVRVTACYHSEA